MVICLTEGQKNPSETGRRFLLVPCGPMTPEKNKV